MASSSAFSKRWETYRPTKSVWFWSSAGCIVATVVVGFVWGGWVTGGTATHMANDSAAGARAQLAAMTCVTRFQDSPDAPAQLATLKAASSYEQRSMIVNGGWVTMPGDPDPVAGAADICADKLIKGNTKTAASTTGQ